MAVSTYVGNVPQYMIDWVMSSAKTRVWWSEDPDDYDDYSIIGELSSNSLSPYGKSWGDAVKVEVGKSVSSIRNNAFQNCGKLSSIEIPSTVKSIGYSAFSGTPFYNNMPDGPIVLGSIFFQYKGECPAEVAIDAGPKRIEDHAFWVKKTLTNVVIPDSVESIGIGAFQGCYNLKTAVIPPNVTQINPSAFQECTSLTEIAIPDGVQNIYDTTFRNCTSLSSVVIPYNVKSIGKDAFYGTNMKLALFKGRTLEDVKSMPVVSAYPWGLADVTPELDVIVKTKYAGSSEWKETTVLDKNATSSILSGRTDVTDIVIGDCILSIGNDAFANCTELTNVTIGNKVTNIGISAFANCTSLLSLAVPSATTAIGEDAFVDCTSLSQLWFKDRTAIQVGNMTGYPWSIDEDIIVPVIPSIRYKLDGSDEWKKIHFANGIFESNVILDDDKQFITDLEFDDGVLSIADTACNYMDMLSAVTIGDDVVAIGNEAFYNSSSSALKTVSFGNGLKTISDGAFSECTKLQDFVLPNGLETIGQYAFSNCTSLTHVAIPDSVSSLGNYSFVGCDALYDTTSMSGVALIDGWAIERTSSDDENIYLNVRGIAACAFQYDVVLRQATIPSTVSKIGENAFAECESLEYVLFEDRALSDVQALANYPWGADESKIYPSFEPIEEITPMPIEDIPVDTSNP